MLGDDLAKPVVVMLVGSLPGLAIPQLGIGLGHRRQPPEQEVDLDGHGAGHRLLDEA